MSGHKLSELPDFEGKALALEVQKLGAGLNTSITAAPDLMLLGLTIIVARLQAEVDELRNAIDFLNSNINHDPQSK